ncbi:NADPH quinone oxidoreductase [Cyberlindnera fabianii]|uniref:enoyl-[acyl-carrier-protein] reductase n=1 Tax=Cyberlindnera fabianii TaxID=36022 RepID=A0A1V2L3F3_CYBFA|nr:NADPH quinone oxidoreductase [Cyberlindnera fabianii]
MFKSAQLLHKSLKTQSVMSARTITTAKSIIYSSHGNPKDVIKVHTYDISDPEGDEIVLKCLGFPINPSDINQLEGVYPSKPEKTMKYNTAEPSAIAGNEGLFEIVKLGPHVKNFSVGDRVITIHSNFGTWTTHNVATEKELIKLPKTLPLVAGATLAVNPATAYQLVSNYGLEKGDWLIQNAGTSGVSQMVSQIAKAKGINVISVIRDRKNFDEVKANLEAQGAALVISETQNSDRGVAADIKKLTDGKLKVALNSVGGASSTGIARKLAPNSTMFTYGGMSKQPVNLPTSLFIFKNLTCKGFWVTENTKKDPQSKIDTTNELVKLYESGQLKELEVNKHTWKVNEFTDDQIKELFTYVVENAYNGKQFIVME